MIAARRGAAGRRPARGDEPESPEISTIHSLCSRILRRHAARLGYPERFAIIDRGEQESLARKVLKELRVADTVLRPATAPFAPTGGLRLLHAEVPPFLRNKR